MHVLHVCKETDSNISVCLQMLYNWWDVFSRQHWQILPGETRALLPIVSLQFASALWAPPPADEEARHLLVAYGFHALLLQIQPEAKCWIIIIYKRSSTEFTIGDTACKFILCTNLWRFQNWNLFQQTNIFFFQFRIIRDESSLSELDLSKFWSEILSFQLSFFFIFIQVIIFL